MKANNFKVEHKTTQLISILSQSLAGKMNMARVKFFILFICVLCKVQIVSFCKLATEFETPAKSGSALRRIQGFMAEYVLKNYFSSSRWHLHGSMSWECLPTKRWRRSGSSNMENGRKVSLNMD
ncbi:MAG: hypothetical protein LBL90_02280 [Prevotellaceae bacterium]|nr:hypothetical protein [Prevotellaceae bacterium]